MKATDLEALPEGLEEEDHLKNPKDLLPQDKQAVLGRSKPSSAADAEGQKDGPKTISQDMIIRAVEKSNPSSKIPEFKGTSKAAAPAILTKQTHLHLNGHRIEKISNLQAMQSLEVLYLYDNTIQVIEGLGNLKRLTHLYLQNNKISEIQGISGLTHLSKLYLQGNCISYVSGLSNLPSLEELNISNQKLQGSQGLAFDMHALLDVSRTLRVLSASSCGIGDEAAALLPPMSFLRKLDLSNNALELVECLQLVVGSSPRLQQLDVSGNPFCRDMTQRFRDALVLMSDSLVTLDGEAITSQQRSFLLRFQIQKLKSQVHSSQSEHEGKSSDAGLQGPGNPYGYPHQPQRLPRGPGYNGANSNALHGAAAHSKADLNSGLTRQVSGSVTEMYPEGKVPSIPSKATCVSLGMQGLQIGKR